MPRERRRRLAPEHDIDDRPVDDRHDQADGVLAKEVGDLHHAVDIIQRPGRLAVREAEPREPPRRPNAPQNLDADPPQRQRRDHRPARLLMQHPRRQHPQRRLRPQPHPDRQRTKRRDPGEPPRHPPPPETIDNKPGEKQPPPRPRPRRGDPGGHERNVSDPPPAGAGEGQHQQQAGEHKRTEVLGEGFSLAGGKPKPRGPAGHWHNPEFSRATDRRVAVHADAGYPTSKNGISPRTPSVGLRE